ncbi:MAG: rRNA maturation RNase YbeY [Ferruginibacter sp.]
MVKFFSQGVRVNLANRKILKFYIESIFKKNRIGFTNLQYIFCNDAYLLSINTIFLKHDFYTDIITFRLSEDNEPIEGEIYISIDRVKENSITCHTHFQEELHRVIFHGALHLCGFNDKTKTETAEMRKAENKCLVQYFKLFHVKPSR